MKINFKIRKKTCNFIGNLFVLIYKHDFKHTKKHLNYARF